MKELKIPLDLTCWAPEGKSIHQFITLVWQQENIPQQWKYANIATIYKNKGDWSICANRREISLLSAAGKVLAKVMLHWFVNTISENLLLKSGFSGFRAGWSTVDMIFTHASWKRNVANNTRTCLLLLWIFLCLLILYIVISYGKCFCILKALLWQFLDGMTAKLTLGELES